VTDNDQLYIYEELLIKQTFKSHLLNFQVNIQIVIHISTCLLYKNA